MRLFISISAAAIIAALVLAGCNSTEKSGGNNNAATTRTANATNPQQPQTPPPAGDNARRITTVEANEALNKGEAIMVDVRGAAAFKQNHIKGSLEIPFNEIASHLDKLPKDKLIITYCS